MSNEEMKPLPVKIAKDFLQKHNFRQVVILANDKENINHIITYGCDKENCKQAGMAGDFWKDVLQWPPEKRSKYTRAQDEKLAEVEEALELCRGQIQEYANTLQSEGYIKPWRDEMLIADEKAQDGIATIKSMRK